jgi:phosphoribosylformylglycinamidine cyclo-ligase
MVVEGMAKACRENGCVLLGGETAEMPSMYSAGEYDLAGFIVGVVDKAKVIDGKNIKAGDVVLGLPSNGLHTNGYSLARKLLFEVAHYQPDTYLDELGGTVGEELLKPHRSYLKAIGPMIGKGIIKGLVHITGGGLLENIPRILPPRTAATINAGSWDVLPVYRLLQRLGNVPPREMYRTFNMGIGMVVVVSLADVHRLVAHLDEVGEKHYDIGRIVEGDQDVTIR